MSAWVTLVVFLCGFSKIQKFLSVYFYHLLNTLSFICYFNLTSKTPCHWLYFCKLPTNVLPSAKNQKIYIIGGIVLHTCIMMNLKKKRQREDKIFFFWIYTVAILNTKETTCTQTTCTHTLYMYTYFIHVHILYILRIS